jgi:hypothetical protein
MRRHALLAAASALVLAHAPQSLAATTISTATTAPVTTSTAGDTTVTSDGSITLTNGSAITLDSDNLLSFNGAIDMTESESGSTGILITDVPNRTQDLTITGDISVTDDYDAEDTNDDDVIDAPFAEGTARYGVRSTGTSAFTGNVEVTSDSVITIHGNDSYGIRSENAIDGAFTYDGAITVYGNDATGLALDNGVTGNVYLSGSAGVWGSNSSAVRLNGAIGGSLIIDGSYSGTGYSTTGTIDSDTLAGLDAALNLLQSGPLMTISGDVAGGILFGASVTSEDDDNTDEDGDGLTDSTQTTASLTQYGGAPALRVASADADIAIGGLSYASTALDPPSVNYGLLVRGTIGAYGIYSGVDTTAVQLGGLGHGVTIANGIGLAGSVTASAYGGDTTALALMAGAATPRLNVTGAIRATTTTATTVDDDDVYTTVGNTTAKAVTIASGASLPTIAIGESASLHASGVGSTASATAIEDRSNTLTSITNSGTLSATITASDDDGDDVADGITGTAIAVNTRTNTVGLTLTQTDTAPDDDDIAAPYIYGKILLGSGDDAISSSGGFIYGDVAWGAGTGSFTLSDGAVYLGAMTSSGAIAMDITGGSSAALLSGTDLTLSSLHVDGDSTFGLTLDTDATATPRVTSTGNVVFDDGATLNLGLDKIITTPTAFTVLTAGNISLGDIETSTRDGYIPYLYHADLDLNDAATVLSANFRLKTQDEAGYSDNQYTALVPVLSVVAQDSGAQASLLSQTDKTGFDSVFNQYLPDYSGEALLSLSLGAQSLNRSLSALTVIPGNDGGQYWLQEYGYHTQRDYGETAGFTATTLSMSGGRERSVYGNQMVGVYASMTAASPYDSFAISSEGMSASDLTAGGYWRLNHVTGVKAWAHAGLGFVQLRSIRNLLTAYVVRESEARWNGYSISAGAGMSYDITAGRFAVTPEVLADYYRLNEAKHTEAGGGDTFDLTIAERDSHMLSATARLRASYDLGLARPEIWLGYRQNVSVNLADTIANFADGDAFTLSAGAVEGGGPVAGFRISQDGQYSHLGLEVQYEKLEAYENTSIALRTRFQF